MALKLNRRWFLLPVVIIQFFGCTSPPTQTAEDSESSMELISAQVPSTNTFEQAVVNDIEQPVPLEDFYINKYEVTNQNYAECVALGVCKPPLNTIWFDQSAYQDHPVLYVSYPMAQRYCEWRGARLPTQAEWEFAANDEIESLDYFWGDKSPICQVGSRLGKHIEEEADVNPGTEPVGSYDPNIYGLFDMTGSVWEWVQTEDDKQLDNAEESIVSFLRMSSWSGYGPVYTRFYCGFRCASVHPNSNLISFYGFTIFVIQEEKMKKIQILCGDICLQAELNQSRTAEKIWKNLPLEGRANRWGDEIYFVIPVQIESRTGCT
jgi:hypothetical protein